MKAIFISEWFDNPYKLLLSKYLDTVDVKVEEINYSLFFIFPILRSNVRPEIVHFHAIHYFFVSRSFYFRWFKFVCFIAQLAILKTVGIKIVWTVHEWQDKVSAENPKNINPLQARTFGRLLSGIITHCKSTQQLVVKELALSSSDKVIIIPHGNYIDYYENKCTNKEARDILNLASDKFVFLIFGGIHRGKGILEAISAFKQLPQEKTSLIIAGKNGSKRLVQEITDLIKDYNNISLIALEEVIPDTKVQIYLNACNCLLLPYKAFTTSGVALLGMSFAKACVAPDFGFFRDVFQDGGAFLYEINRVDSLYQAMKKAFESELTISAMERHNLKVAEEWNWNLVAKRTSDFYQWCLGN